MDTNAITALANRARSAGLDETDFDETVYDLTNSSAAVEVNHGNDYDFAHQSADDLATTINNSGLSEQLLFIASEIGPAECERLVNALIARQIT
jgi:hypothetical protein